METIAVEKPDTKIARPPWPAVTLAQANAILTGPGSAFEMEAMEIRGTQMRTWKHAPRSNREVVASARAHDERIFLVNGDETVSFNAFHRAVAALARDLRGRGLRKGDRVVIAMRNLPEWVVAFYAASVAGAIATPLNAWWTGPELLYGLKDSRARFAFVDPERYERIAPSLDQCTELESIYVSRAGKADGTKTIQLETVIGNPSDWNGLPDADLPDVEIAPDDDATIFYTSGTTGSPKGALATHRNMLSNITGAAFSAARTFVRRGEPIPAPDPAAQNAVLITVPFFHVTGCFAILSPVLNAGSKLVMMRRWDTEEAMRLIERERVTAITAVPTIALQLVEHPAREKYDLSSLVGLGYGGASAPPDLMRRINATMPQTAAGHGWGMTETSALALGHSSEDYANRPTSCGPSLPVGDIKIMHPDSSAELPIGEVGELWFKGPQVVKEYWNKPDATQQTFIDGWVKTGDLARVDEEGFCYIVDRAKDILIRGGENIYCVEVENVLYDHPAVMDAALVGRPHRLLGEEPVGFVTLKEDSQASAQELRAFVAERLASFKVPAEIVIQREPLPRNANGKILKPELRNSLTQAA